ncbi:MAG: META domain-containing protein [Tannerellaceae bacterium]|nr:META domain-containing protein [Tannerellaceae bacterium]
MNYSIIYPCLCLALAIGGCKSQKLPATFSDLEGRWKIVELNGNKLLPEETTQHLIFDTTTRRLSGNAGCNQISGNITHSHTQANNIKFQGVISTRKACLDMRMEDEFLKALDRVARFDAESQEAEKKTMTFYDADHQKLFVIQHITKE